MRPGQKCPASGGKGRVAGLTQKSGWCAAEVLGAGLVGVVRFTQDI